MPTALDVVKTALAVPLPCPVCGRTERCRCIRPEGYSALDTRANLIVAALVEHGVVSETATVPSEEDLAEMAMLLAARSRHPRYTQTERGWKMLLDSAADVNVAYNQALRHEPSQQARAELEACRAALLAYHERRPSPGDDLSPREDGGSGL